ncbi:MAG: HAD-IC family P-type ATPase [Mycoplasmoidaceae bacterium]|nr:HAD-IC family P-type ATPase [Mycoplasmoidaceae bacterium]
MIVTVNLAKEAFKLSKQKTIVKNINSIQSFGAMDVLCTDKTGTLTEDRIVLERHINLDGKEDNRVLVYGYLNSFYQTGLKNLLDLAIIEKAETVGFNSNLLEFKKIDEIPFDFKRRRMSVVLSDKAGETQLVTKGAIEEIVSVCTYAEINGEVKKLNDELREKIKNTVHELSEEGMRVIAIAINNDRLDKKTDFSVKDETNMRLIGYIALLDPPKMSASGAIQALQKRGTEVKVLTGDNELIAQYVCRQVGIKTDKVLLGNDVETMSDEELKDIVMSVNVFAKLSPEQKERVVLAIKSNKHIVGYMGDGINDAPAMRAADIAISVDTAVDIAKECADIILLEKNLMVLENGIIEGRKTFANIIKYIKMTVSSNFGNILSILIASI